MKRVLFLCDRPLGTRCLEFVIAQYNRVCGVVSRDPDENNWWGVSGVRNLCKEYGIPWYPLSANLNQVTAEVSPDVIFSILYPKIVPKHLIESFPCFNLHCAPLPEYGGWNATLWAILNGEKTFGVTLHEMTERPDEGPIVEKSCFPIPPHITNAELYTLSHEEGYRVFREHFFKILSGQYSSSPPIGMKRYYRQRDLPPREVDLRWEWEKISTFARAFYFPPFEPAYAVWEGKKIWFIPERRNKIDSIETERWEGFSSFCKKREEGIFI